MRPAAEPSPESGRERAARLYRELFADADGIGIGGMRERFDALLERFPLPAGTEVAERDFGGVPGLEVSAAGARPDRALVWFHGGGYTIGSARGYSEMAARLSAACRLRVLLPDYRLAPENRFPAAIDDALAATRWALGEYGAAATVLGGDSAGAGLVFAALPALRDAGDPLPHRAAVFSPLVDLTGAGESLERNAATDGAISAASLKLIRRIYLGETDPLDPRASPVGGELGGLPPALVLTSGSEVLLDGAAALAARIRLCGGEAQLEVHEGMVHAWPLFPFLPESEAAIREVAAFLAN